MKPLSSQIVFMAAAGVLAVGGVAATQIYRAAPKYTGPSTEQILATSRRLQGETAKAPDAEALFAQTRAAVTVAAANRRAMMTAAPTQPRQTQPVRSEPAPAPSAPSRATTATAAPATASGTTVPALVPGSNLALTGIAGSGSNREAMFFNLTDQKRENGRSGDTVFGFTIAAIHDDSVEMTQGATEVTLRLGEKAAAVNAALSGPSGTSGAMTIASTGSTAAPFGTGTNPNGNGGRGDWRSRMAAAAQANFNAGNGNRNNGRGGNNNNRRRSGTTQSGARRYSSGPDASRRYSTVSSGATTNRNRGFGNFRGGGFGGFGGRGWGGQNQMMLEATSNPQEARRTGAPLIGGEDVEAMFQPEAISNPQTERRTGGTSGQAFGNSNFNNRNGNSRSGFGNTGRITGGRSTGFGSGSRRG